MRWKRQIVPLIVVPIQDVLHSLVGVFVPTELEARATKDPFYYYLKKIITK